MNKKGLQLKLALFAVVAFSMVIIATGVIIGGWDTVYNSGLNYDLSEYNSLDSISGNASAQKSSFAGNDEDQTTGDFEGTMFKAGYKIIANIWSPFRSVFNMFNSLEQRFGLPSYVGEGVLAMVFFAMITMIIAIIFRLPRGNA